uniref:Protein Wnt n=1 Tax=Ciona savignyi TaxID=51511 RepID=H2Y6S4_CIOSA
LGNRETAFLFSISSAGLTHAVARACANGHLKRCSCDDSYDSHVTDGSWRWDGYVDCSAYSFKPVNKLYKDLGRANFNPLSRAYRIPKSNYWEWKLCGDNVHYAAKFVRRFLKSRSTSRDIRAEVDKHNSDLGIRVVKSNVKVTCKCHGVSGSCTTKTCWRKMAPFYEIGRKIKRAYDKAVKVGSINNSNGRARLIRLRRSRLRHRKLSGGSSITSSLTRHTLPPVSPTPDSRLNLVANTYRTTTPRATLNPREELKGEIPRNKELVYLEKSPTYCRKSRYSKGTKGRVCKDERSCDKVCCGRGYTTHVRLVRRSCQCEVKWCCAVHCNTCSERKKIHTCK